jgi:5-formyltetrahydrofolate cyclo-ligase
MTIGEIRAKKNALRKKYKKIRVEITSENKSGLDLAMTQTVLSSMSYKYCKTLLLFSSFGDEPDTTEIAKKALAEQIPVRELILQEKILSEEALNRILDVHSMTAPGISGKDLLAHRDEG